MEFYSKEQGFLEELLGVCDMEYLSTNQDFTIDNGCNMKSAFPSPCCFDQALHCPFYGDVPFGDDLSPPDLASDSSTTMVNSQTLPYSPEDYYSMSIFYGADGSLLQNQVPDPDIGAQFKVEPVPELPTFNMGLSHESERKNKVMKKLSGQPSKNLMAERRRRKRLNDRLSMLRSVVPKISKMNRTSILGDTIDYMKELLEKINKLQEEMDLNANELGLLRIFKTIKPPQILISNAPKFEVERRNNGETKIEICCGGKPGLLLSTVATLEALGIDIQHSVISCFHDFAMQASCSQEMEQSAVLDSEDIKEALLRNAGYGGRC